MTILFIFSSQKRFYQKIFEGEMFIRILPTTLFQIFCENLLYFQVIFKSMKIADDTFLGNSACEWVKTSTRFPGDKATPDYSINNLCTCTQNRNPRAMLIVVIPTTLTVDL